MPIADIAIVFWQSLAHRANHKLMNGLSKSLREPNQKLLFGDADGNPIFTDPESRCLNDKIEHLYNHNLADEYNQTIKKIFERHEVPSELLIPPQAATLTPYELMGLIAASNAASHIKMKEIEMQLHGLRYRLDVIERNASVSRCVIS